MAMTLNHVLDERKQRSAAERWRTVVVSAIGHSALAGLIFALPALFAEPPEKFDYVAVTVIPPKALGSTEPPPPPPPPAPEPRQEAPPPPPPAEPEPKPTPERPTLVEKKPDPKPPPPKPPPPKPAAKPALAPPPPAPIPKRQGSPFGSAVGVSKNETAVLGVEDPNFTYGYYLDLIVGRISANWTRPPVGGDIKDARVYFRIEKNGTVKDLALRQTSGDESFDQSALLAVKASSPLPPLPKGYKRDFLGINLVVK
ncbi:MAG: energy transducer TonB [Acidobacteriota bacterium]